MMRGGNREMRRMMDKMGLDMSELPNVQEVIIKTDKKEIIIRRRTSACGSQPRQELAHYIHRLP